MEKEIKTELYFCEQITNAILFSVTTVIIHEGCVEENGT